MFGATLPTSGIIPGVTTGHIADHIAIHEWLNGNQTILNVKTANYGAIGDGVADDTAAIAAAVTDCPAGGIVYFPSGVYRTDPIVIDKSLKLKGDGEWDSWLIPTGTITEALVQWVMPTIGSSPRNYYGSRIDGIGIDLTGFADTGAAGLDLNVNTGWFKSNGLYINGDSTGAVGVRNAGTNNSFERFRMIDCSKYFEVDGETGLELSLTHGDCTTYTGATPAGIEVVCTTGTTKGALYMHRVVINADPAVADLQHGLLMTSAVADLSVPVFATQFVVDNASGPYVKLVNIRDTIFAVGWGNSAAGTTAAVEYAGGGNNKIGLNNYFGGTAGTVEFTGADSHDGLVSVGNTMPSEDIYKLTGAGKPTDLFLWDRIPLATVDSQITDDLDNLIAGTGRTWGGHWFTDRLKVGTYPQLFEPAVKVGTLVAGEVTLDAPAVDGFTSQFLPFRFSPGGTLGHLTLSGRDTVGETVTITSLDGDGNTQTLDTSIVGFVRFEL